MTGHPEVHYVQGRTGPRAGAPPSENRERIVCRSVTIGPRPSFQSFATDCRVKLQIDFTILLVGGKTRIFEKNLRGKIPRAVSVRLPRDQSLRLIQRASPSPITLPKNTGLNKNRVYDSVFFFGVGYTYKVCHYSSNIIYP